MIGKRETPAECTWSLSAGEHVAQQHDGVMDRLRGKLVLNHAADGGINVFKSQCETNEPRRGISCDLISDP
jgi:hypothetical protein